MSRIKAQIAARRFAKAHNLQPPQVNVLKALAAVDAVLLPLEWRRLMLEAVPEAKELNLSGFIVDTSSLPIIDVFKKTAKIKAKYLVWINPEDPPERQRFTIMHEIAHVVLHHPVLRQKVMCEPKNTLYQKDPLEQEADSFAAEVLAPISEVKRLWANMCAKKHPKDIIVSEMQEHFLVSKQVVLIQLERIGALVP